MPNSAFRDLYVETDVLAADPVALVRMLYRGALDAVAQARRRLAAGDIKGRSHHICSAIEIVAELSLSIDRSHSPAVASNLVELYDYVQRLLVSANLRQADPPLAEAARLLDTLLEAWKAAETPAQPAGTALPGGEAEAEYHPLSCAF